MANSTSSLTLTPTTTDSTATVKVNGTTVSSGSTSAALPLIVGTNTLTVLVTAQDGTTTSTYTLTVTRAPSSVSTLSGLTLSSGTLSPAFASGTTSYAASVGNSTSSLTLTPTTTDSTATVKVNGTTVSSGSASNDLPLNVGENTLTVLVTAQDGTTTSTYTLTVTRAPSSVSTLSGLTLSSGTLSPAFASGTTSYAASVGNSTSSLTLTPTTTDSTATVKVNGTTVSSGSASNALPLIVGENTLTVLVAAQDGTTTSTYTLTVTRAPSSVSTLASLVPSAGALVPAFSPETHGYTINPVAGMVALALQPTAGDAGETIRINGTVVDSGASSAPVDLVAGTNQLVVAVTAADGVTVTEYQISITVTPYDLWKAAGFSSSSALADNSISGDLASPLHDGVPNLVKYALGLSPLEHADGLLPTTSLGNGRLTLTYRRNKQATDLTYTVQACSRLADGSWSAITEEISRVDMGAYWLVTVRDSEAPGAGRFLRLSVSR